MLKNLSSRTNPRRSASRLPLTGSWCREIRSTAFPGSRVVIIVRLQSGTRFGHRTQSSLARKSGWCRQTRRSPGMSTSRRRHPNQLPRPRPSRLRVNLLASRRCLRQKQPGQNHLEAPSPQRRNHLLEKQERLQPQQHSQAAAGAGQRMARS